MQLPKLTLVPPKIQSGDLFPALELVMSSTTFKEAIGDSTPVKLLRSVGEGMLLTWDRGLHSFKMVKAALNQKCQHLDWVWRGNLATPLGHILGRIPANVKFEVVQELADGSYISWIAPDRKSKKKGSTRIPVRVKHVCD